MDRKQELLNRTHKAMTMACMAVMLRDKFSADSVGVEGKVVLDAYQLALNELSTVTVELAKEMVALPEEGEISFEDLMKSFNEEGGAEAEGET